jgi:predicted nucleic acid-binding protein
MPFVMDASVTVCWAFPDEVHATAALALERIGADKAIVPTLWWYEIRNALIMNERRHRISASDTAAFLRLLSRLRISVDQAPEEPELLSLSRRRSLTVSDATYLELALRNGVALATLDGTLARAAQAEHVSLLAPAP